MSSGGGDFSAAVEETPEAWDGNAKSRQAYPSQATASEVSSDERAAASRAAPPGGPFVAALDVGTTSVRCVVLDRRMERRGLCRRPVRLLYPQPEHVEIDPDQLFEAVCEVIRGAISDAGLTADQIATLGISTQRASFTTWSRETGKHYHNIVCWNDRRASDLVQSWNASLMFRLPAHAAWLLHKVTGNPRLQAVSVLRLMNQQVTMRLLWCMQNVASLKADIAREKALFGTVETVPVCTGSPAEGLHVSDRTTSSVTGFYDPYLMCWSGYARFMFGVAPPSMLPRVVSTTHDFGATRADLLGAAVPLGCVIGDQGASLFGAGYARRGDVAVTLGTGSFMDVNTGASPHTSVRGLYPAVAWQRGDEVVFMAEGSAGDTAVSVLWGRQVGLYDAVEETAALAASVPDAGGVLFVPAFSGLAAPVNDFKAAAGFIGVTAATTRAHLTRAILQAIAFRLRQLYDSMRAEAAFPLHHVRVSGGVANNDLVCQLAADVLDVRLERPADVETSVRGAAALAGLAAGVWRDEAEVDALRRVGRVFTPDKASGDRLRAEMVEWGRAVQRFGQWYADDVK
ncbi:LOW QUALITY PROTEIN: putative glycerol kinase 5 [Pollicipes pollicipes]|uniref:LOW QUALITY PROTEIN: putative glycerol kinase 5 n=1 Tax=Pollicipes pollicipes TaxID=41117 RepID=UPI0018853E9A|nr:LOW QUALITY PROTEIN: putative glycerol kinase 5 [Pollicipes pollicipes]